MISKGFKKQLITNAYNTQFLLKTDSVVYSGVNSVDRISISSIKRIQNLLLFEIINDEFLFVNYKYKYENIDYYICWFLNYLTDPIYSIYNYKSVIRQNISGNIKNILDVKHEIDNRLEYIEYMEDIYDK